MSRLSKKEKVDNLYDCYRKFLNQNKLKEAIQGMSFLCFCYIISTDLNKKKKKNSDETGCEAQTG